MVRRAGFISLFDASGAISARPAKSLFMKPISVRDFLGERAGKCIENAHTTSIARVFHVHFGSVLRLELLLRQLVTWWALMDSNH